MALLEHKVFYSHSYASYLYQKQALPTKGQNTGSGRI